MRPAPQCAKLIALGLIAVLASVACDRPRASSADDLPIVPRAPGRVLVDARWDTVFETRGGTGGASLGRPRLIETRGGELYAYDYANGSIKAYGPDGALRWQVGGPGQGPAGLRNVVDLESVSNDALWAIDYGPTGKGGRIVVISGEGAYRRSHPLSEQLLRLVPTSEAIFGIVVAEDTFLVVLDSLGRVVDEDEPPLDELRTASPNMRQPVTTGNRTSRVWAAAFPFGDVLLVYRGRTLSCAGRLVEGQPFPSEKLRGLRRDAWAVSIALQDSSVFVLPKGRTEHAQRVLDEYSLRDCRYRRTLRLPKKVSTVEADAELVYLEYQEPAPGLLALRLRSP